MSNLQKILSRLQRLHPKEIDLSLNRVQNLSNILQFEKKWTSKSPQISSQNLVIYVLKEFKYIFPMNTKELYWF